MVGFQMTRCEAQMDDGTACLLTARIADGQPSLLVHAHGVEDREYGMSIETAERLADQIRAICDMLRQDGAVVRALREGV